MKTVVSKNYRFSAPIIGIFTVVLAILLGVGLRLGDAPFSPLDFIWILGLPAVVVETRLLRSTFKGLLTVHLTETEFVSSFHKKVFCTVDKSKPVYYVYARISETTRISTDYILLSNEEIRWTEHSNMILEKYRLNSQILIPYTPQIKKYFDFENWTACFPKESKGNKLKRRIAGVLRYALVIAYCVSLFYFV